MSAWNGARGLVSGTTSTISRALIQQLESPALANRVQIRSHPSRVANRTIRTATLPLNVRCHRQHHAELAFNKSQIRTHIRMLEMSRRRFATAPALRHGHIDPPKPGEELHVTFIDKDGDRHEFEVSKGDNLLDIAQANDLEMEGACGGSCACSTCHVIVDGDEMYDKMEEPSDDENDMLDLAFGLTETSRLGCQVVMSPELDGLVVKLPKMTRNMQASDFEKS